MSRFFCPCPELACDCPYFNDENDGECGLGTNALIECDDAYTAIGDEEDE